MIKNFDKNEYSVRASHINATSNNIELTKKKRQ